MTRPGFPYLPVHLSKKLSFYAVIVISMNQVSVLSTFVIEDENGSVSSPKERKVDRYVSFISVRRFLFALDKVPPSRSVRRVNARFGETRGSS